MFTWMHYAELAHGGPIPADQHKTFERLYHVSTELLHSVMWSSRTVGIGTPLLFLLEAIEKSGLHRRVATDFVMGVIQAVPLPELPYFTEPIFHGVGDASTYRSREALAMLWECYSIASGLQQGPVDEEDRAECLERQHTYLREIVRSVTGEDIVFVAPQPTVQPNVGIGRKLAASSNFPGWESGMLTESGHRVRGVLTPDPNNPGYVVDTEDDDYSESEAHVALNYRDTATQGYLMQMVQSYPGEVRIVLGSDGCWWVQRMTRDGVKPAGESFTGYPLGEALALLLLDEWGDEG